VRLRLIAFGCVVATALLAGGCGGGSSHSARRATIPTQSTASITPVTGAGIHKIRHIVVIM